MCNNTCIKQITPCNGMCGVKTFLCDERCVKEEDIKGRFYFGIFFYLLKHRQNWRRTTNSGSIISYSVT